MKSATRVSVSTFGAILGIAGLEHGFGEVLQGDIAPEGFFIQSWPNTKGYEILNGEPAMTIVPNLLITGILAIIVSIILMIWVIGFIERKYGSLILFILSVLLLLVGGGFGPPIIGFIITLAATRINSDFAWWKEHVSVSLRNSLSNLWKYLYVVSIISWFSLWPGLVIAGYFFTLIDPLIVIILTLCSFTMLLLTIFSAFAYDSGKNVTSLTN